LLALTVAVVGCTTASERSAPQQYAWARADGTALVGNASATQQARLDMAQCRRDAAASLGKDPGRVSVRDMETCMQARGYSLEALNAGDDYAPI
jgi:hypothetical protein